MRVDELEKAFEKMSEAEKKEAFKRIMPRMCETFKSDPQQMMTEMMPVCREMMQNCGMDPQQMMNMMQKMREKSSD